MTDLTHHAKLKQLARNLHIPDDGDCLRELRDHAIASVQKMLTEWSVETIGDLRSLVADKLSVKIESIGEDQDTERLAEKYGQVMSGFRHLLGVDDLQQCERILEQLAGRRVVGYAWARRHQHFHGRESV